MRIALNQDKRKKNRKGDAEYLSSIAFTIDGRLITNGSEKNIKFWNVQDGVISNVFTTDYTIKDIIVTPDGSKIICGSIEYIYILDAITGEVITTIKSDIYNSLVLSLDGTTIVQGQSTQSGGGNFTPEEFNAGRFQEWLESQRLESHLIKVWDVKTGDLIKIITDTDAVLGVAISADKSTIISSCKDNIKVWDANTGDLVNTLDSGFTTNVIFKPYGLDFVSLGAQSLKFWSYKEMIQISSLKIPAVKGEKYGRISSIDMNNEGTKLAIGSKDRFVYILTDLGIDALKKSDILVGEPLEDTPTKVFLPRETRELIAEFSVDSAKLDPGLVTNHYKGEYPFTNTPGGKRKTRKGRKNKSNIKRRNSRKNKR
jgi:WD40 repeat protein